MHDESRHSPDDPDYFQDLKSKSLAGIGSLLRRQIFVYGFFFLGNIVLARILVPQLFGIYAIVAFVVQFFSTFSDVGIGAALIQKKDKLNSEELSTIFWLQQILVFIVVILVYLAAPLVLRIYTTMPPESVWLIRVMALSFLFTSLKTVPAILMERAIDFNKVAWVDISESAAFQVTAISLALTGFGVWSFIVAALIQSVIGVILIYSLSSWRPSFQYNFDAARGLIGFGLPYQGNTILSFIKDAVTPLFVGAYAGAAAVGYVNWARNLAFSPLMLSQSFGRVAFPAYARLQHDKILLQDAVERSIRMMTLIMFPITTTLFALGPEITHVIFTDKWRPGLLAFYFYCTSPCIIGIMLPLYSAILSLGKSNILLKMASLLLVLEWGLGVPFVLTFGYNGISFSQPIIGVIFYFIYKHILSEDMMHVSVIKNIYSQSMAAVLSGIVVKIMISMLTASIVSLIASFIAGSILYVLILYLIKKEILLEVEQYIKEIIGGRQTNYEKSPTR
jgi:O-antigen/teichoic acid export membrane protein